MYKVGIYNDAGEPMGIETRYDDEYTREDEYAYDEWGDAPDDEGGDWEHELPEAGCD